jgi:hypothetical protein
MLRRRQLSAGETERPSSASDSSLEASIVVVEIASVGISFLTIENLVIHGFHVAINYLHRNVVQAHIWLSYDRAPPDREDRSVN